MHNFVYVIDDTDTTSAWAYYDGGNEATDTTWTSPLEDAASIIRLGAQADTANNKAIGTYGFQAILDLSDVGVDQAWSAGLARRAPHSRAHPGSR